MKEEIKPKIQIQCKLDRKNYDLYAVNGSMVESVCKSKQDGLSFEHSYTISPKAFRQERAEFLCLNCIRRKRRLKSSVCQFGHLDIGASRENSLQKCAKLAGESVQNSRLKTLKVCKIRGTRGANIRRKNQLKSSEFPFELCAAGSNRANFRVLLRVTNLSEPVTNSQLKSWGVCQIQDTKGAKGDKIVALSKLEVEL